MTQVEELYKQINSLQEQILSMAKMISDQAAQITPVVQGAMFQLKEIERHQDLIITMKKEMDNLKAEVQRQSLAFLKQTVSH